MIDEIIKQMKWLGHDAFLLNAGGKIIYFDPFQLAGELPAADIILVSHEHYDHCSPEDIEKIQTENTVIVTEPQAAKKVTGKIKILKPGENCEVAGVRIEAVPSYNTNKKFHPEGNSWLGFVLTIEGTRIYHAGDTDLIPEMKDINADIALLPVSGTYVMTAEEAVEAALAIRPKVAIPMHYDAIVGSKDDARRFADGLAGKVRVEILSRQ